MTKIAFGSVVQLFPFYRHYIDATFNLNFVRLREILKAIYNLNIQRPGTQKVRAYCDSGTLLFMAIHTALNMFSDFAYLKSMS